ncbi:MAG: Uma2 family endonuclease [Pirellulales bacterium]
MLQISAAGILANSATREFPAQRSGQGGAVGIDFIIAFTRAKPWSVLVMASTSPASAAAAGSPVDYPTRDGRPLGETPLHASVIVNTQHMLVDWFAHDPMTYVWGNMMMYYVPGDKWKHLSPDVFVVRGVPKDKYRKYYLTWEEGKAPDLVVEITSQSTRKEDLQKKMRLYRDVLKVSEYFLFDPEGEYLTPRLQGYRLKETQYVAIEPVDGRLPSEVTSLHFEADGTDLRLWDPASGKRLLNRQERAETAEERAETAEERAETAEERAETAEAERQKTEAENAELRREIEALRRQREGSA